MRILELRADNFKRLKAVTVVPSGNIVEITGQNGEGKTSTLDAIWALVGGKDASPDKPIRTGEESATITALLGDGDEVKLKITRKFRLREGGLYTTDLFVESGEGARFSSPQGILDALVGSLCFDPLAFTRLKDDEQLKALRAFVPEVNFTEIEGLNRRDFEERTDVNRHAKELRAQIAALPTPEGDTPAPVDLAALESRLADTARHNGEIEQRRIRREATEERVSAIQAQITALTDEMHALQKQLSDAPALPSPIDADDIAQQLASGRERNDLRRRILQREALILHAADAEKRSVTLTQAIETRKEQAAKAVASAKMPVPGLGFGDGFVTLNGEPLGQASSAEQIRASVAIAAAMNPKLRVARVLDGSLLDKRSWAALETYAMEADLQIWIETVDQKSTGAIHIADGGVVAGISQEAPIIAEVGDVV